MLSSVISIDKHVTIGEGPLVKRFMKGVYQLKPIWDVDCVLTYLKTLTPVSTLPLQFLSYKLLVLLLLLTGQRVQTVNKLKIDDIKLTDDNVYIEVSELIKTSKPGCHLEPFNLPVFKEDSSLCIVLVLKEYLNKTSMIRKSTQLFLNCIKAYANVSKATLARWVKEV